MEHVDAIINTTYATVINTTYRVNERQKLCVGRGVYLDVVFNVSCMAAILTLVITVASHRLQ